MYSSGYTLLSDISLTNCWLFNQSECDLGFIKKCFIIFPPRDKPQFPLNFINTNKRITTSVCRLLHYVRILWFVHIRYWIMGFLLRLFVLVIYSNSFSMYKHQTSLRFPLFTNWDTKRRVFLYDIRWLSCWLLFGKHIDLGSV